MVSTLIIIIKKTNEPAVATGFYFFIVFVFIYTLATTPTSTHMGERKGQDHWTGRARCSLLFRLLSRQKSGSATMSIISPTDIEVYYYADRFSINIQNNTKYFFFRFYTFPSSRNTIHYTQRYKIFIYYSISMYRNVRL